MSTLAAFAAHARAMASAEHVPTCCRCGRPYCCGCIGHPVEHPLWHPDGWTAHAETCPGNPSAPPCPGCVTDADRALWARLADEAEAYLGDAGQEVIA